MSSQLIIIQRKPNSNKLSLQQEMIKQNDNSPLQENTRISHSETLRNQT